MKTLLLANQKGGVGKSAVACQLAHYLAELRQLRVLVLDLDHQANTTKALKASGAVSVATTSAASVLDTKGSSVNSGSFVLVPGDDTLMKMEKQANNHNAFASNLRAFLASNDDKFDVCIIDTNPNPDIRMVASLVASNYVLSPIELNQEAIDGIGSLIKDIRNITTKLNPGLTLLGILPNKVTPTPFQKANFEALVTHFSKLLLRLDGGSFAKIKQSTAIAEAQAEGKPVWKLGKTSGRDAWRDLEPTFTKIAADMGLEAKQLKNAAKGAR